MIHTYGEPTLIVFAVIGGLYAAYKVVWPWLKTTVASFSDIADALTMLPQAVQSLTHQQAMQKTLTRILAEVMPNGGSSLRDSVMRQEKLLNFVSNEVALITGTFRANADADPEKAMFECDDKGENIWVNQTYCGWTNKSDKQLLGWGFLGIVAPADRELVREEWLAALGERRHYSLRHRMLDGHGGIILVDVTATPIPEGSTPQRWIGVIRKVKE